MPASFGHTFILVPAASGAVSSPPYQFSDNIFTPSYINGLQNSAAVSVGDDGFCVNEKELPFKQRKDRQEDNNGNTACETSYCACCRHEYLVFSTLTIGNSCFVHKRLCKDSRRTALELRTTDLVSWSLFTAFLGECLICALTETTEGSLLTEWPKKRDMNRRKVNFSYVYMTINFHFMVDVWKKL